MRKGPILLYFVDDPENKVPLGPVNFNYPMGKPQVAVAESPREEL